MAIDLEFTPVLKATGLLARPASKQPGYDADKPLRWQEETGLRLNWKLAFNDKTGGTFHLKNQLQTGNMAPTQAYRRSLFRYRPLSHSHASDKQGNYQYDLYQEIDRLSIYREFSAATLTLGRQAISWGLGRLWQTLDIFGAFSPLALDREYKPGIDAIRLNWYPSDFSQWDFVYVASNTDIVDQDDSLAAHFVTQISNDWYISLLGSQWLGHSAWGLGAESQVMDAGIRVENLFLRWEGQWRQTTLLGMDYQFSNGLIVTTELLYQSRGARTLPALNQQAAHTLTRLGLQQQLSQTVVGVLLQKNLYPLLDVSYVSLVGLLGEKDLPLSLLQQLNFLYSTSDESDLTVSIRMGSGKKLTSTGLLQSEFGHIPLSLTAQLRWYLP